MSAPPRLPPGGCVGSPTSWSASSSGSGSSARARGSPSCSPVTRRASRVSSGWRNPGLLPRRRPGRQPKRRAGPPRNKRGKPRQLRKRRHRPSWPQAGKPPRLGKPATGRLESGMQRWSGLRLLNKQPGGRTRPAQSRRKRQHRPCASGISPSGPRGPPPPPPRLRTSGPTVRPSARPKPRRPGGGAGQGRRGDRRRSPRPAGGHARAGGDRAGALRRGRCPP